ncbi:DNA-binding transcriptional regulator Fis [Magnetovirga frankeli]|uniref:DNA-binding transcriptional regulator Fis n=1 Tax=Magnetovirga frankeli TaxID=947516 RepID=UPI0012931A24|nr:DNA-binding transcriptional regulator Fis [gamma proteobacterium SS-5]
MKRLGAAREIRGKTLAECVTQSLEDYLHELDGHQTSDLYQLVLSEVERPMLRSVLNYVDGNQTRAAAMLGISRGTLRKKLSQHGLD